MNMIYCGREKPDNELKQRTHLAIWLGGDHLPDLWRTDDVCANCNNMSGLYVDGSSEKLAGQRREGVRRERVSSSPSRRNAGVIPLNYMGVLPDVSQWRDDRSRSTGLVLCAQRFYHTSVRMTQCRAMGILRRWRSAAKKDAWGRA